MCCYFYKGASKKYRSAQPKRYSSSNLGHERRQALMANKWLQRKVRDKLSRAEPSSLRAQGASSQPHLSTSSLLRPGQAMGEPGVSASDQQNRRAAGGILRGLLNPKGPRLNSAERAGRSTVTPHPLASLGGYSTGSAHVSRCVQDVKYQRPENEKSNESPHTHAGTCYWQYGYSSETRPVHAPKDGAHRRPLTIPIKAHPQS